MLHLESASGAGHGITDDRKENAPNMKIYALRTVLVAFVISLALAPAAFAGDTATSAGYRDTAGNVQQQVAAAEQSTPPESRKTRTVDEGSLPFTGMELGFIGMAGIALLGLGFGLRMLIRRQPTA
ncbi:MAG: hypothetical protein QOI91_2264 [Solirubrobacteraceae bacterium]|jgi:hypothetical protein|nr:hypothetical protein [Solirubrobacteraceae bacterium]